MPSIEKVNCGLGRKKAVISAAFISSTFIASARRVGFAASNRALTSSQVRACCADASIGDRRINTIAAEADGEGKMRFIHNLCAVVCTADTGWKEARDVPRAGKRSGNGRGPVLDGSECLIFEDRRGEVAWGGNVQGAKRKLGKDWNRQGGDCGNDGVRD